MSENNNGNVNVLSTSFSALHADKEREKAAQNKIFTAIPSDPSALSNLLATLQAEKAQAKAAKAALRVQAKEDKKNRPKTLSSGGRTLSAEIKKTKKNEDGSESEAKGAISISGLNRLPHSIYAEQVIPLLGFMASESFASILERDAENASFQFGDKDADGKPIPEKGTARTIEKMQNIAALIRQIAIPVGEILHANVEAPVEDIAAEDDSV